MKRLSSLLLIALGAMALVSSCKSGDVSNVNVPKDAAFVLHINNSSLSTKLSWQEIQATSWFKEAYAEANDSLLQKMLDNPDNSGIDSKADMVLFVKKQGRGGYLVFQGLLKDAAAFEAFNKKISKGATAAKSGDGMAINITNNAIAYWEGTRFVYVSDVPMPNFSAIAGGGNYETYKFSADSLQSFAKASLKVSGKESLGSDERFAALIKETGDAHIWLNNDQYLGALGADMLGMMKAADLIKGNVSAMTLNFDNGKINIESKAYLNDQLTSLFKKYPPKKISASVINRIPSKDVVAVMAMNYSPEGLKELIKLTGLDGMANGFLEKANYSIDEFIKANKGDMIIAVSDLQIKKEEVTYPSYDGGEPYKTTVTKPDMNFLFATTVNDKAAFDKLINTLSKELGDGAQAMAKDVTYQINNEWFAAGNSADYIGKFLAGGNSGLPFTSRLDNRSFGLFIDIQKILKSAESSSNDSLDKEAATASLKMWEDVLSTSGEFKNGAFNSHTEINLVDKSTNSLKQLNQYINTMHGIEKRRKAKWAEFTPPVMDDSTTTEAIVAPPTPEQ